MHAKRKQADDEKGGESENVNQGSSGSGLLRKRFLSKLKGVKVNKSI